ncbi:hypothetical protein GO001_09990 [Streptomyces sp. NRRL B-1677]|uniref:Uncharacterized protein n=1 Tax=Streptomyces klenkii TaxID=1420899 RepID=A0A3B0BMM4_9ACTN|nr:hypothetical protein [Streptomyces sp. NRRL B-1677]MBF6045549.1 hypothetical protein [Streptomyces sp. NRRL B-1677]RKN72686.1 hypothetical protein D7231_14510 [Streptomyces klenkii]
MPLRRVDVNRQFGQVIPPGVGEQKSFAPGVAVSAVGVASVAYSVMYVATDQPVAQLLHKAGK